MSKTTNKYFPKVRERAVRLVFDNEGQHGSRWQAIMSNVAKIGCAPQTLNNRVKNAKVNGGKCAGRSRIVAGENATVPPHRLRQSPNKGYATPTQLNFNLGQLGISGTDQAALASAVQTTRTIIKEYA